MDPEYILHEKLSIVATVGVHSTPNCVHSTPNCSFGQRHQNENRRSLCWFLLATEFECIWLHWFIWIRPMVRWKWSPYGFPTLQALKGGAAVTVAEVKVWVFLTKMGCNMGIAIINHPLLMVYTTHLWWLGGWFIHAIPTLYTLRLWLQNDGQTDNGPLAYLFRALGNLNNHYARVSHWRSTGWIYIYIYMTGGHQWASLIQNFEPIPTNFWPDLTGSHVFVRRSSLMLPPIHTSRPAPRLSVWRWSSWLWSVAPALGGIPPLNVWLSFKIYTNMIIYTYAAYACRRMTIIFVYIYTYIYIYIIYMWCT